MPDRDQRVVNEGLYGRYEVLLDGRADGSALGDVLEAARVDELSIVGDPPGLDAALAGYRATTGRAAVPSRWRRRRSRAVRGVATATLTTKLVLGTVAAAAVGGLTVVTVEHVRPSGPVHTPRSPHSSAGESSRRSESPPPEQSFAPVSAVPSRAPSHGHSGSPSAPPSSVTSTAPSGSTSAATSPTGRPSGSLSRTISPRPPRTSPTTVPPTGPGSTTTSPSSLPPTLPTRPGRPTPPSGRARASTTAG